MDAFDEVPDEGEYPEAAEKRRIREESAEVLRKWRETREAEIQRRKAANRMSEEAALAARRENMSAATSTGKGTNWARVCSFIDFTKETGERDTSRMKGLLLQLKNKMNQSSASTAALD
eukprot:GHVU01068053.1.p2 GENE.GHVU01068053.1~~GHVU01068053.1.p2  ORF type:complete len:119 (-),score=26.03 GHVU01068053.1:697-1053(-)